MEINNFFKRTSDNFKDNKEEFLKGLQSNVINKKESLNHFNDLILNKNKENK